MIEVQKKWQEGFIDGWNEQGILPTSEPSIPAMPTIPADIKNHEDWAYTEGKKRGMCARLQSQSGISVKNT